MRIDVTLWYRLITKGVITPNCYDGNSTISSTIPTSPTPSHYIQYDITQDGLRATESAPYSQYDDDASPPPQQAQYVRPINATKSIPTTNEMPINGSSTIMEKNKNNIKGPPPPVAPKPSWPRQTSTVAAAAAVIPPSSAPSLYSQLNDENKTVNDISNSNINVNERHPSQKFNRSSSMNQISTNIIQQHDIASTRNKSLSIPDSRFIY